MYVDCIWSDGLLLQRKFVIFYGLKIIALCVTNGKYVLDVALISGLMS